MAAPSKTETKKNKVKLFRKLNIRYTQEKLEEAIDVVRSKRMSLNGAAKYYGIPYGTLGDKIRGRRPIKAKPKTVFSPEEEQLLINWLIETSHESEGHTRAELKEKVKEFLDSRGRKTIFKDNRPGKIWILSFLKRHSEIASRIVRGIRSDIIPAAIDSLSNWFDEMQQSLDSLDPTLLESPDRIFTASEFVFSMCPETGNVTGLVNPKSLCLGKKITVKHVTVWVCASASGQTFPPISVFWNTEPGVSSLINRNEITENVLLNFLRDTFIPHIDAPKPVVLFTAGLSNKHTEVISDMCGENAIILQHLKTKESYMIHALYHSFYDSFNSYWNEIAKQEVVDKEIFSFVLKKVWDLASKPEIFKKSFELSGIYPYNPNIVLNSEKLKQINHFQSAHPDQLASKYIKTENKSGSKFSSIFSSTINEHSAMDIDQTSSSSAVSSLRNHPDQNVSRDSFFKNSVLRLFKLMKFNFRIGEEKATTFMKMYTENRDVCDNAGYRSWKLMMDSIMSQMKFNFNVGEQTVSDFIRRYEDGSSPDNDPLYKEWKSLMDSIMSQCTPSSNIAPEQQSSSLAKLDELPPLITVGSSGSMANATLNSLPVTTSQATSNLVSANENKANKMQEKCYNMRGQRKISND